jgi:hypothetical protein
MAEGDVRIRSPLPHHYQKSLLMLVMPQNNESLGQTWKPVISLISSAASELFLSTTFWAGIFKQEPSFHFPSILTRHGFIHTLDQR